MSEPLPQFESPEQFAENLVVLDPKNDGGICEIQNSHIPIRWGLEGKDEILPAYARSYNPDTHTFHLWFQVDGWGNTMDVTEEQILAKNPELTIIHQENHAQNETQIPSEIANQQARTKAKAGMAGLFDWLRRQYQ